jgi:DNA-binding IclR family transcriptional regulator
MRTWTFMTNHARVLRCIATERDATIRQIALCVDLTERATHRIINDLVQAGYVTRRREGPRNVYVVHPELPLRHAYDEGHQIGELLAVLTEGETQGGLAQAR